MRDERVAAQPGGRSERTQADEPTTTIPLDSMRQARYAAAVSGTIEVGMNLLPPVAARTPPATESFAGPKPRRPWSAKFGDALRGLKRGIRGHSSFSVHFFFAVLVAAAALVLNCAPLEWCLLIGCIGMVLTAELFNSAIETIFHGLDEATKPRVRNCLDIAAGAVLMASVAAALIGSIVILNRLATLLFHAPVPQ